MSDLLLDLVTYWKNEGIVTADGTDAFRDIQPDNPNLPANMVSVHEYPASGIAFINNTANRSIQIRVRNTDYAIGKSKAMELYNSLYDPEAEVRIIDFSATRWGIVKTRELPYLLNKDETERYIFTFRLGIVTVGDS